MAALEGNNTLDLWQWHPKCMAASQGAVLFALSEIIANKKRLWKASKGRHHEVSLSSRLVWNSHPRASADEHGCCMMGFARMALMFKPQPKATVTSSKRVSFAKQSTPDEAIAKSALAVKAAAAPSGLEAPSAERQGQRIFFAPANGPVPQETQAWLATLVPPKEVLQPPSAAHADGQSIPDEPSKEVLQPPSAAHEDGQSIPDEPSKEVLQPPSAAHEDGQSTPDEPRWDPMALGGSHEPSEEVLQPPSAAHEDGKQA